MMTLIRWVDVLIDTGAARITTWRQARCGQSKTGHRYVYAPQSTRERTRGPRTGGGHYLDFLGDRYACVRCGKELTLLHGADGRTREHYVGEYGSSDGTGA